MRIIAPLVLLASANAFADPESIRAAMPPMPPRTAAPSSTRAHVDRRLPSDVGQFREARVEAPEPVDLSTERAETREHDVAPPHAVAVRTTDPDVAAELAARQMRRLARAFDPCKASALKRAPSATGGVTLALEIADRRVQSARVTEDGVHDPAFAACVTSTAGKLSFNLAAARLAWHVPIR